MTDWTKYTTEELERLTTLTEATATPGEFVRRLEVTTLRIADGRMVSFRGNVLGASDSRYNGPERRVVSFTDATELDPPQAEMLAELARRKAPVFKVGELVAFSLSEGAHLVIGGMGNSAAYPDHYRVRLSYGGEGLYPVRDLRPATDAEVAAYHRAHCQPKVEPKPAPKPASISNATHAGKKVRWFGGTIDYIVANMADGRIEAAPGIAVFLIEPSYGAIRYCYNAKELALSNGQ